MEAIELLEGRRSVRKFLDKKVERDTLVKIMEATKWAPSWGNFQVARYTLINDEKVIKELAGESVNGFVYNINTLKEAKGVAILSFVKGKSGKLDKDEYATTKESSWEVFDAGIACQTFCLAAHANGVGTCIMGVINDEVIAKVADLPDDETAAAIIVYGYEDGTTEPTPRKEVEELTRFIL